ncbi:glycosyltransferase family 4 protein [Candidatus Woesearchaeota archaeon]|nr:glycosyltransferase family 4 protein [Candidatus Woesearchaeota archaeon]
MKLLYISHKIPYPLSDGGKLRSFNHIKHLSKKHRIVSLSFIESKDELKNIGELRKYCKVEAVVLPKFQSLFNSFLGLFSKKPLRVWYLRDRRFREKAKELTKWADLVIIQALRMSQYGFFPEKSILDVVDTPSLQIKRALKFDSWIWGLELGRIEKYEKRICRRFKNILVASEDDRKALGKGVVLKNGTEIFDVKRKDAADNNIMFLGNMEYQPNVDAVRYFIKEVFPLIKKRVKNARFYVVGKNSGKIKKYASKDVVVTGFVKDLNEYFSKCKVFVAPMRLGSGIQNKVLEALNYEIPVVTTSIVNNGIGGQDGKEIIVADGAREFAEKVVRLLKDKELRKKLGSNGKKLLKNNYSWKKIYRELDEIARI